MSTRVLIARGHQVTPWELRPWAHLPDRFEVFYLFTGRNLFGDPQLGLGRRPVRTLRDFVPRGRVGDLVTGVIGDRYIRPDEALADADIVHGNELHVWYTENVARRKRRHGFKLVQTVWETLPLLSAYRTFHARPNRERILELTDLFLPATERARQALLLEGVPDEKIVVAPPGIELDRFRAARDQERPEHVVLSPGRLEWQKGHHDVLRAVAAIRRGIVAADMPAPRVRLVGAGPEEARLREHAHELGIGDLVEFRQVSYDEMPAVFGSASCLVLASLPSSGCQYHPLDLPRCFWEEQFGMVLAEGMAAGLPILASESGAIPEVLGDNAAYFAPGDWMGIARALVDGPLARDPAERVDHPPELLERYSLEAAGTRLAAAYDRVLA